LPLLLDVYGVLSSTLASISLRKNPANLDKELIIADATGLPAMPKDHAAAPADMTLTRHPAVSTGRIGRARLEAPRWRRPPVA
jgi:hypothetical protein